MIALRAICSPKVGPIARESKARLPSDPVARPNSSSSSGSTSGVCSGGICAWIWKTLSPKSGFSVSWIFAVSAPSIPPSTSASRSASTSAGCSRATWIRVPDSKSIPRLSCLVANATAPIARMIPETAKK